MVRPVFSKTLVAATAMSIGVLALTAPAVSRPNPRDTEATSRTEIQRNAQLRHARNVRGAARKRAVPAHAQRVTNVAPGSARTQRPAFGWPSLVTEARKYVGTNPTTLNRRWCARFLNFVLNKTGYAGTNSDAARSFASYGRRVNEPRVGAIAVLSRGKNQNLGHVGIVTGVDANGNPMIISGNHGHKVGEAVYPRSRVIAYVMPTSGPQMTQVAMAGPATPVPSARPSDTDHATSSPIDELLAAINAEPSSARAQPAAQPQPQIQAQPAPARPTRLAQAAVPLPTPAPRFYVVPQPRPAPYRIVQQTPMPVPDPRNVLQ
jgi:uncharacterized protein (TIGR02594 family)